MNTIVQRSCFVLATACATAGVAQIPPHAVRLNSTNGFFLPSLARSGETVHAVGGTGPTLGPPMLHYARSLDGGRTWPIREYPIASPSFPCGLAVDGDHVHAVVESGTVGPFVVSSHDGGTTWLAPVRVSQASSGPIDEQQLHVDGTTVLVAWPEIRPAGRVWCNRSIDGGLTWQPTDTRLDVGLVSNTSAPDSTLRLVADGTAIHLFWTSLGATIGTAYQRSLDGGATWLPAAQLLSNAQLRTAVGSPTVLFAVDLTGVIQRSVDHGTTWTPWPSPVGTMQALAVEGQDVLAVGAVAPGPVGILQLDHSRDGGLTWLPTPYTVSYTRAFGATAFVAGGASFVRFRFSDNLQPASLVIQSDDDGISWRSVMGDAVLGLWAWPDGCLALTQAAWWNSEVWAWVLEGHTTLGQGTPGTGGIVPVLAGTGLAGLGRTFALDVDGAAGGSLGAYFVTFGAAANVPFGAATLYLQQPVGPFWFTTSAVGTASLPITVPTSAWFVGLRLLSQAFVLDPVAVDGFTATRAIETWFR